MAQRMGVIRWLNNAKGYVFLGADGEQDVFVHYSSIQASGYRTLKAGDTVYFDVIDGEKGPEAAPVDGTGE